MNRLNKGISAIIAIILSLSIISTVCINCIAAQPDNVVGTCDYIITNPYKDVNWDTWKAYKSATHVHTVRSDGNVEVDDMIEDYYAHGYQCLALTDHGTVNYSWHEKQTRLAIFDYQYFVHGKVDPLSDERYIEITTGADRGGDGMIEIPLGIELNGMSTAKCHVNSYFADCGHGDLAIDAKWPEDAVKKCQNAGGICHINHVGEWTDGKDDIGTYDESFIAKFSNLFMNYSSCIGMELVNTKDNRTHNDRYLYDKTLEKTAPSGRNIFGFCEDDSHDPEDVGNNAQYFLMPQNTAANVRTSMETGAFFACSKNAKTADELNDGFNAVGEFPMINRVDVDDSTNQISIFPRNATKIKMVANGKVICEKSVSSDNQKMTFDLNEFESQLGSYVRFYVTGPGGICYIQPFLLKKTEISKSFYKFNPTPYSATVTVKDAGGNAVQPANENREYLLDIGKYTYTVSADNYDTVSGELNVINNTTKQTVDIKLQRQLVYSNSENICTVDYSSALLYGIKIPTSDSILSSIHAASGATLSVTPTPLGCGTGTVITATDSDGAVKNIKFVYFGDVNGDGFYNGTDALIVSCIAGGMLTKEQAGEAVYMASDCNHDGAINQLDVDLLQQAGVLLASVGQSKTPEELQTSSAYVEYLNLIDQILETETVDTAETEEPEPVVNPFKSIIDFFKEIMAVIRAAIAFIDAGFPGLPFGK